MKDDARSARGGNTVQAVLDAVYEASLQPERWPEALTVLAAWLRAAGAFLQVGLGGPPTATVSASAGLEVTALLAYRASDPLREPLVPAVCHKVGEVLRDGDGISREEVHGSELGRLLLAPAGLGHLLGASLACDETFFAAVWAFRPAGTPFSDAEADALREVVPHLQRAVAIQRRIAEAEQQAAASSAALNRIALGAIVVDVEARPLLVNRLAEHILAQREGLFLTPAGLAGGNPAATLTLRTAIRDTITSAARNGRTSSVGLRLERHATGHPLEIIVVSLKAARRTAVERQSAIVFVADPERAHITPERLLRDLYGLTAAEARLALVIAQGASLTGAARQLEVTRNTVHAQLTSIFLKTGTSTQAELVRLLHRGAAAIRPYEDSSEQRPVRP